MLVSINLHMHEVSFAVRLHHKFCISILTPFASHFSRIIQFFPLSLFWRACHSWNLVFWLCVTCGTHLFLQFFGRVFSITLTKSTSKLYKRQSQRMQNETNFASNTQNAHDIRKIVGNTSCWASDHIISANNLLL